MVKRSGSLLYCLIGGLLACSGVLFGQANSTINGRVVDQAGAAVPGASVSVTNAGTAEVRQTVTNGEGLYSVPALIPGNYNVKAEFTGFSATAQNGVSLLTGTTLTVDLKLAVGATNQTVSVEASAALVETTESTQGGSLQQTDVAELPMLERSMGALMALIPGSRDVSASITAHGTSSNYVSVGGGGGTNFDTLVDGIENKEDQCGGTMIVYSLDGIQEFKTMTNGANAEYGRGAAQVLIATKSGTNTIHGAGFVYFRNQDLIRTDYLSDPAHGGLGKAPFLREQFGGSVGGPVKKDKLFYFASTEYIKQNFNTARAGTYITLLNDLIAALPSLGLAAPGGYVPQPSRDLLYQGKVNYTLNDKHSLFARWSGELGYVENDGAGASTGLFTWQPNYSDKNNQFLMNGTAGDAWVINPTTVNQFTAQWISFKHDNQYPVCPTVIASLGPDSCLPVHLSFLTVSTSIQNAYPDWFTRERKWQWKDDLSKQMGRHALKVGVDYMYMPTYGGFFASPTPGTISFFADPNTIAGNLNGLYPQGFQTPGILKTLSETSPASGALGIGSYYSKDNWTVAAYGQDDFRLSSKITLNVGLRWDAYSLFNSQANLATNPTYLALKAIGSPYGVLPDFPQLHNYQPRIGMAWDPGGDGKNVFRLSYGVFYTDQIKNTTYQRDYVEKPQTALFYSESLTNSALGVGQLSSFIYGVTPFPSIPPITQKLIPGLNTIGYWYDPTHIKDAQTQQYHIGWSHLLGHSSVISIDHTDILLYNGWRTIEVNPLLGGVRPLAAALGSVLGSSTLLSTINLTAAVNHAFNDESVVHFERRFSSRASFQVNYVLGWSQGMGGAAADGTIRSSSASPQFASAKGGYIYEPWEYGPTGYDERHRITATGVFNLPWKIEVAPTMTWATARPYTLTTGPSTNGDATVQAVNPVTGLPNGIGTMRGLALFVMSARVTRNFHWGKDGRYNVGAFGELYNLTDRPDLACCGGAENAPATFGKATTYLGGAGSVSSIPNSFQVQFGARFKF